MPTYAYACTSCGHRFDIYQAFSDSALTECAECGGALRKQFGNVGVVFKGSGFYRNDARGPSTTTESSGSPSSASESSESTTSSTTKESGGTDAGSKDSGGKGSGSKDSGSTVKSTSSSSTSSTSTSKAS